MHRMFYRKITPSSNSCDSFSIMMESLSKKMTVSPVCVRLKDIVLIYLECSAGIPVELYFRSFFGFRACYLYMTNVLEVYLNYLPIDTSNICIEVLQFLSKKKHDESLFNNKYVHIVNIYEAACVKWWKKNFFFFFKLWEYILACPVNVPEFFRFVERRGAKLQRFKVP